LILRKIIKIVATRCRIYVKVKCTKLDFGWELIHSAPPHALAGFKGSYFYGNGGMGRKGGRSLRHGYGGRSEISPPRSFLKVGAYGLAYTYKKLSYCWETVRRENMPRIAEMDVEMTT